MSFTEDAYEELYGHACPYHMSLSYSGRFKPFNANIKKQRNLIWFSLSRKWQPIDTDVKMGLVQDLLCKLFRTRKDTAKMRLYRIFVKNMHIMSEKDTQDPELVASFNRVNEAYFMGSLEMPNLEFRGRGRRTLATYDFHTDTVRVSTVFRGAPERIIDYLVYHELLHKVLQFDHTRRNARHHTKRFKEHERRFAGSETIEKDIERYLRTVRR